MREREKKVSLLSGQLLGKDKREEREGEREKRRDGKKGTSL